MIPDLLWYDMHCDKHTIFLVRGLKFILLGMLIVVFHLVHMHATYSDTDLPDAMQRQKWGGADARAARRHGKPIRF